VYHNRKAICGTDTIYVYICSAQLTVKETIYMILNSLKNQKIIRNEKIKEKLPNLNSVSVVAHGIPIDAQ
jgi:hypothetical protein